MKLYFAKIKKKKFDSLGIKTLDPASDLYVGYYNNSDDSDNKKIAHGYSYHNVLINLN